MADAQAERPKRKRPPDLVDRLCKAVEELTAERASRSYGPQWVIVHDVARRLGISDEQATALALERLAHVADSEDRRRATTFLRIAAGLEDASAANALR